MIDMEDVIAAETEIQNVEGLDSTLATWETEAELDLELAALKEAHAQK